MLFKPVISFIFARLLNNVLITKVEHLLILM